MMKTGISIYTFAGILLATLLSTIAIAAAPYTWIDEDGKRHFGDQPPPGVNAEQMDMSGSNVSFIGDDTNTVADTTEEDPESPTEDAPTVVDREKQQELCEQARKNREAMNYGGIIRQQQPDGEVIVLTPEQKQEQRELADEIISAYCTD